MPDNERQAENPVDAIVESLTAKALDAKLNGPSDEAVADERRRFENVVRNAWSHSCVPAKYSTVQRQPNFDALPERIETQGSCDARRTVRARYREGTPARSGDRADQSRGVHLRGRVEDCGQTKRRMAGSIREQLMRCRSLTNE
jgi:hypothetical protein